MKHTPDGDGSLLDHSAILYGAGMSEGNGHVPVNLPILLVGGGNGQLKGGRHIKCAGRARRSPTSTSACSTSSACAIERHGNSTGPLNLD